MAQLIALALLGSYLITKHRQRERARARQPLDESHMTGTEFDTHTVAPRLRQVRQDYVAQIHLRPKTASHREAIRVTFRDAIRRLSYFHNTATRSDWSDREREQRHA